MATTAPEIPAQPTVEAQRLYQVNAAATEFYARQLPGHPPAADYLQSRGIGDAGGGGSPWRLGYAPPTRRSLLNHLAGRFTVEQIQAAGLLTYHRTGGLIDRFRDRLVFPIADHTGQVAGFTARDLSGHDRTPTWVNTPDTPIYTKSRLLYGLGPQLQHPPPGQATPLAVVVEGAADVLAIWRMAQTMPPVPDSIPIYAVAACGTNLTTEQLQLLRDHLPAGTRLAVALDGDRAGQIGYLRAYPLLMRDWPDRTWAMTLPAGADPASLLAERGPDAALAELARRTAPAARTALRFRLDQLSASGRITHPRNWIPHRVAAYQAIAEYFVHDPSDTPALAQAAADRLGLPPGVVAHGVVEQVFPTDVHQLSAAAPGQDIASQAVTDWLHPRTRPEPDDHPSQPTRQDPAEAHPGNWDQTADRQPHATPEPDPAPAVVLEFEPELVEVAREQLPPAVSGVAASQHRRWPVADAAADALDRATGRWAWALADGIGERPQARAAAEAAARVAAATAARANPAAGIAAAGAALHTQPATGGEDAAIMVATAHPAADGATRVELAWSGNVRAYALHGGQVIQVTADHTVAQQQRETGHRVSGDSQLHHLLTSSVRHGPVSRTSIMLPPGGALLLATAGAYRHAAPTVLRSTLHATADPHAALNRLLRHTAPGDNARAVLLRAPNPDSATVPGGDPARLARLAGAAAPAGHTPQQQPPAASTAQLIAQLRSQLASSRRTRAGARR